MEHDNTTLIEQDYTALITILEELHEILDILLYSNFLLSGIISAILLLFIFFFFLKGAE